MNRWLKKVIVTATAAVMETIPVMSASASEIWDYDTVRSQ